MTAYSVSGIVLESGEILVSKADPVPAHGYNVLVGDLFIDHKYKIISILIKYINHKYKIISGLKHRSRVVWIVCVL